MYFNYIAPKNIGPGSYIDKKNSVSASGNVGTIAGSTQAQTKYSQNL